MILDARSKVVSDKMTCSWLAEVLNVIKNITFINNISPTKHPDLKQTGMFISALTMARKPFGLCNEEFSKISLINHDCFLTVFAPDGQGSQGEIVMGKVETNWINVKRLCWHGDEEQATIKLRVVRIRSGAPGRRSVTCESLSMNASSRTSQSDSHMEPDAIKATPSITARSGLRMITRGPAPPSAAREQQHSKRRPAGGGFSKARFSQRWIYLKRGDDRLPTLTVGKLSIEHGP
ncbi:hypothetical protein HPP92_029018 [Vanilla planifolia]|uniref:Uncharacterized protein n=1 Tax=Vanilla planifolia TaxID=51239 RepID=A0A835P5V6_VANPL|nr:hypothetical protein HPP92_029006 [Vanilla planifolia]KAG0446086.1 hypothetical protein HPP92_029018 [Vanilla planifolia]